MSTIDYYFYAPSPFTYLGHDLVRDVAKAHGASLNYKPVDLMGVWKESGAVPPGQRPPIRQAYRLIELERLAHFREVKLNPKPKHFPVDGALADRCAIAIVEAGGDPHDFVLANSRSIWVEDEDISDEAVLRANLMATGHSADQVISGANAPGAEEIRKRNTHEAIAVNAPGVPAYVLKGEVFWGQDRIEHLDHMLKTDRAPILAT